MTDGIPTFGFKRLGSEMLAGTTAGIAASLLFYPLECLEARMQVSPSKKSPIAVAKQVVRAEGVQGLYRGLSPTLLGSAVNWGIYFALYKYFNHIWIMRQTVNASGLEDPTDASPIITESSWVDHMSSAILAGAITTVVVNPFWVLKIRLATSNKYRGLSHALTSIIHTEGYSGLWKGVGPSLIGVSEGASQFVVYEQLRRVLISEATGGLSLGAQLFAGGASRLVAGLCTYPYAVLRSSLQAQNCPYEGLSDACRQIYRTEGAKGFYRGLGPNLVRNIPPSAVMLYIVEYLRKQLVG